MRKTSVNGKKWYILKAKVYNLETLKINLKKNAVTDFNTEEFWKAF